MLPAGMVADSRPRNAQSVSVAVAETRPTSARSAGLRDGEVRWRRTRTGRPTPTSTSGSSFRTRRHDLNPARRPDADGRSRRSVPRRAAIAAARRQRASRDEAGNERVEVADEGDSERAESRPDRNPVAPRDEKRRQGRRTPAGCRRTGPPAAGSSRDSRAKTSASRIAPPADTSQPTRLSPPNGASDGGQEEDARADHVAHDQRDSHPEAEGLPAGLKHAATVPQVLFASVVFTLLHLL